MERAQEAAVRLVLERDGALAAPAAAPQRVEATVVAGAREGVGLDAAALGERVVRQLRPDQRGRRVFGGHLGGGRAGREQLAGLRIVGQVRRGRAPEQVLVNGHDVQSAGSAGEGPVASSRTRYVSRVPVERRSPHAWVTRSAIPASASLPQLRGSYAFLLPTSPSTFSTPS